MPATFTRRLVAVVYLLLLTLLARRAFFYPSYDMDMLGYIGNAVAISGASVAQIHDTTYRALDAEVPPGPQRAPEIARP